MRSPTTVVSSKGRPTRRLAPPHPISTLIPIHHLHTSFHPSNPHRRRIPPHKDIIHPPTQRPPHRPLTHPAIPIRRLLQILQDQRPIRAEGFHESEDSGVFVDDGLGDGGGDADDFLEHARVGGGFVVAGADLAGVHAEGCGEGHADVSVYWGAGGDGLVSGDEDGFGRGDGRRGGGGFTCRGLWRCAG